MYTRFVEPLLSAPVSTLDLSREFILVCELAGFHSVGDLLGRHTSELLKLPGFSYHLLGEYVDFLESHSLAHYLDQD
jgi:DNA-directed RNA polymerase alpha subunit